MLASIAIAALVYWGLTIIFSYFQEKLERGCHVERRPMTAYPRDHQPGAPHVGEVIVQARGLEKYFGDNHVLRGCRPGRPPDARR